MEQHARFFLGPVDCNSDQCFLPQSMPEGPTPGTSGTTLRSDRVPAPLAAAVAGSIGCSAAAAGTVAAPLSPGARIEALELAVGDEAPGMQDAWQKELQDVAAHAVAEHTNDIAT